MSVRTISAAGGNTNSTTCWDEGVVPTAADDIVARGDGTSGNITINASLVCRSADFTNYTGTVTHAAGIGWSIGTSTVNGMGIALRFVPGMNYVLGDPATSSITWGSTSGTQLGITLAGHALGNETFSSAGGSYKFLDDHVANLITHTRQSVFTNGKAVTATRITQTSTQTRTWDQTGSTVTITSTAGWVGAGGSGLTLITTGSTIILTANGTKAFGGNGNVFNDVTFTGSGVGAITGANTFHTLTGSVTLPAGVTNTVNSYVPNGSFAAPASIRSVTPGSAATLSAPAGTETWDYIAVRDIAVIGGVTVKAKHATDEGGNSGISFVSAFAGAGWGAVVA